MSDGVVPMPQTGEKEIRVVGRFGRNVTTAVIIPTYNEADNIRSLIDRLFALEIDDIGIVFVDDSSPDKTGEIADDLADVHSGRVIVVHRAGKLGLGTAYVAGFKIALDAGAQKIVQMDCDLSHPPSEVPGMLAALKHGDVVVGTRYSDGGDVDPNWKMSRVLLSKWANWGIRSTLGLKVHDATGGFKAYRREAIEAVNLDNLTITGFGFQAEVAYLCQRAGLTIVEHPYTFMERTAGKSKMSLRIAIEALWRLSLLRLKPR